MYIASYILLYTMWLCDIVHGTACIYNEGVWKLPFVVTVLYIQAMPILAMADEEAKIAKANGALHNALYLDSLHGWSTTHKLNHSMSICTRTCTGFSVFSYAKGSKHKSVTNYKIIGVTTVMTDLLTKMLTCKMCQNMNIGTTRATCFSFLYIKKKNKQTKATTTWYTMYTI